MQDLIYIFLFIFGACIGSFLNVCIYRMPRGISLRGRSFCPACKKKIAWYDNIPLVAIIALKGRCRHCGAVISKRYFAVELLTALLLMGLFRAFGFSPEFFVYGLMLCALMAASFVDIDYKLIPDSITLGGLIMGLSISFVYPGLHGAPFRINGLAASSIGALAGGGSIYLTGLLGNIVFRRKLKALAKQGVTESMGGGDVKLMAMAGSIIGWKLILLTFFIAPFFGAIAGIILKFKYKAHIIPYGPYLAIASLISVFWGNAILKRLFY